jgi:hypothetical protein
MKNKSKEVSLLTDELLLSWVNRLSTFLLSCLFFWSCSFSFVKTCYKICGEEIYKLQERTDVEDQKDK